jgi:hypothetical protein
MPDNKPDTKGTAAKADLTVDTSSVDKAVNEAAEQGYYGTATDPTPRENYSVAGVTSGAPTPETDEKAAADAREAVGQPGTRVQGR